MRAGCGFLISDSWEAGAQNWTDRMIAGVHAGGAATIRTRGCPTLTGRVVESAEASDRFLWDFRRTLADMLAEYHYDQITAILKQRGMGHYGESHEGGRAFIGDGMEAKRSNDVPMSAMWTQRPGVNAEQHGYNADIRESASVAHLYGKNLRRRRVADGGVGCLGLVARDAQAHRRQGAGDGPEPVRDPHVGPPAARWTRVPGLSLGPLRPMVHAQRDLGRAGAGMGDATSRAAPSCCSRAASSPTSSTTTARTRT